MIIVVVTPPFFLLTAPACAPAVLTGVLRARGHDAINFDANGRVLQELLLPGAISRSVARLKGVVANPGLLAHYDGLPNGVNDKIAELRTWATYRNLAGYVRARHRVESVLRVHALAHGGSRWSSVEFQGDHDRRDAHDLLHAVQRGGEVFDSGLDLVADEIAETNPGLVALSVSFPEQLYGTFRLAWLLRQRVPEAFVCVGGATVTRVRDALVHIPELFDIVDAVILREGETPLASLADALSAREDPLRCVPEMLVRRDGIVVHSEDVARDTVHLDQLPTPVFDESTVSKYLAPAPHLTLSTTRNCYFDKCTFCAISRSFNAGFRQMTAARIVHHIRTLNERFPGAVFKDVSEAVKPQTAFAVADALAVGGEPPAWEAYLRFEAPFATPGAAARLRRGGLTVAYFGLESGSPDQVEETHKAIDIQRASRTLRQFAEAGIWNHLFLISGLPRETEADHEATIAFLREHRGVIHSVQTAAFRLEIDSDAASPRLSKRYRYVLKPRAPWSLAVSYDIASYGDIPEPAVAHRRADALRRVAYGEVPDVLASSRRLWDGHKVFFKVADPALTALSPALLSPIP